MFGAGHVSATSVLKLSQNIILFYMRIASFDEFSPKIRYGESLCLTYGGLISVMNDSGMRSKVRIISVVNNTDEVEY